MSESPQESHPIPAPPPAEPVAPAPLPRAATSPHTPVKRIQDRKPSAARPAKPANTGPSEQRREFFSDAMRETLAPFAGLIERKINPILAALEAFPTDIDRFANVTLPSFGTALDQPQLGGSTAKGPKNWPLAEVPAKEIAPVRFLRPPGAAPQGQFENNCTFCNRCVEVCPAHAIRMDGNKLLADGLPYIVPTTQPCVVCDSLACMVECPTGALTLVDRLKIKMGTARVNLELCVRETGEDCRLCLNACPIMGAGAGPEGEALFIHEASGRVRVRKIACVGCGLCENRCPTNPPAITVEPFRAPVDPIVA
jgi:ferredoxin-type protein NapG